MAYHVTVKTNHQNIIIFMNIKVFKKAKYMNTVIVFCAMLLCTMLSRILHRIFQMTSKDNIAKT